jgi:flagellar protein FlbD
MIRLTRIRQNTPFILNPDLIERVDTHVDTIVRLTSGTEYVVNETGDDIVRLTIEFRARVLALAGTMTADTGAHDAPAGHDATPDDATRGDAWAPEALAGNGAGAPSDADQAHAADETANGDPVTDVDADIEEVAS